MAIPSSLFGLLLFVVLLWPGFVYTSIRDKTLPDRQLNPWRDTVTIASVSLTALALVAGVFGLLRVLMPGHTPAVRPLVVSPQQYIEAHYVSLGWWAAGLLALAVLGAAAVAALRSSVWLSELPGGRLLAADRPHPSQMSSWWMAFSAHSPEEYDIHVGCTLDDGSFVSGILYSYSQLASDGPDRDLVLTAPLSVRPAAATAATELERAGLLTLSARHIVTMTVSYVSRAVPAPGGPPPAGPPPSPIGPLPPGPSAPAGPPVPSP